MFKLFVDDVGLDIDAFIFFGRNIGNSACTVRRTPARTIAPIDFKARPPSIPSTKRPKIVF